MSVNIYFFVPLLSMAVLFCIYKLAKNRRTAFNCLSIVLISTPTLLYTFGFVSIEGAGTNDNFYYLIMSFFIGCISLCCASRFPKSGGSQCKNDVQPIVETKQVERPEPVLNDPESTTVQVLTADELARRKMEYEKKSRMEKAKNYIRTEMCRYKECERMAVIEALVLYSEEKLIVQPKVSIPINETMSNDSILSLGAVCFYLVGAGKIDREECTKFLKTIFTIPLANLKEESIARKLPGRNSVERILEK